MNKSRHVTFRCTQEQYDQIMKAASSLGFSKSQFVLRALMFAAKSVSDSVNDGWVSFKDKP